MTIFAASARDGEMLDVMKFPMKVVNLIQNISKIILNLSKLAYNSHSQDDVAQAISIIHEIVIQDSKHGLIQILKMFCLFKDYIL